MWVFSSLRLIVGCLVWQDVQFGLFVSDVQVSGGFRQLDFESTQILLRAQLSAFRDQRGFPDRDPVVVRSGCFGILLPDCARNSLRLPKSDPSYARKVISQHGLEFPRSFRRICQVVPQVGIFWMLTSGERGKLSQSQGPRTSGFSLVMESRVLYSVWPLWDL